MSANLDSSFSEETDLKLTAYLDGELSPVETQLLERELVDDEGLRIRLAELRQTYDLLDDLPETPHDQRFTQSTIEHVVQSVRAEGIGARSSDGFPLPTGASTNASSRRLRWPLPRFLSLILLCAVAGASLGLFARSRTMRHEIRELSLITNAKGLLNDDSIEIAKTLSQEEVALRYLKLRYQEKFIPNVPKSRDELLGWLESLNSVQKAEFSRSREMVSKLDKTRYQQIRTREDELEVLPDQEQVQETVRLIGLTMESLLNAERMELDEKSTESRIEDLKKKIYLRAADYYFSNLSNLSGQADGQAEGLPEKEENVAAREDRHAIEWWYEVYLVTEMRSSGRSQRDTSSKEKLIDALVGTRIFVEEERLNALLEPLHGTLSDDAQHLLKELPPADQMRILFDYLAPNRPGSSGHFIELYTQLPVDRREVFDLGDPETSRFRIFLFARSRR